MAAYYNEFKPEAAHMLRQLIKDGLIADGTVDDRSITDVRPEDLKGFTQCHFFAGIGGWSVALRQAGWADDRPVWTGSCPCQPFSTAGKQKGKEDERHIWPIWAKLIAEVRPSIVFGEQVASAVSHGWLDGVYADLEAQGYACGAAVLPACSVDAPHKRDRLWFVAHPQSEQDRRLCQSDTQSDIGTGGTMAEPESIGSIQRSENTGRCSEGSIPRERAEFIGSCFGNMGNSVISGRGGEPRGRTGQELEDGHAQSTPMADSTEQLCDGGQHGDSRAEFGKEGLQLETGTGSVSFWDDHEWLLCGDGKIRRIPSAQSGICKLVDGIPNDPLQEHYEGVPIVTAQKVQGRAALLHALGNAIVPEVAARFIRATM